ncbi:MAG: UvrD-helicase domain-containing protein [Flavobacteriales bacterium]|nr:UvrD-helicase domain-containing protein [Flavobacteriales bacterium]
MNKNFQIYRSSAGSGKTYTLSLSFIALALKGDNFGYKDYYRKILAITFTNKAASEMKERVLEYLNSLSNEKDNDGILLWLVVETRLTEVEIYKRAGIIHKHILHNYADLGISTIDKFTYKIVRTFASDLGLSHNFDLEMDTYKIIQPVVALLLTKMSNTGGDLSDALVNFAMQKAEDGKSTNIERDLEIFSQELFKEEVAKYVDGELLSVSDCMLLKKDLQKTKNDIALKVEKLADKVCIFFDTNGFTKEHFNRGTFYTHFTKNIAADDNKWMPTDALIRYTANGEWYTKSKKQEIKDLVDSFIPQLEQFFIDLMDLLTEYNSVNAVLKNIYSIAVLNELMIEVRNFKKENNIEQISEFNKKIHNVVTKQPASFIYERLGERYNHYLIDEFQDTSLLQWQNILPLVTDSLDNGKSMVVGDGKQSIYRWRGGEVEQFFKLPEIYKGDDLLFKQDWESKLAYHENVKNLKSNFRSRKNIIEFNNQFFENTKTLLSQDIIGIYDKAEQESKQAKDGCYVHIELLGDKENDATILILEKLVSEIKKLKEKNNYSYSDVAILCNSKKSVSLVAEQLSLAAIPVISNEGLLLHKSEKVNVLLALLKYLQNPKDKIAKTVVVDYLSFNVLKSENRHDLNLLIKSEAGFVEMLTKANVFLNPLKLLQEPLYEMVEQIIRLFHFNEDVYLQFFLDVILAYSEKNGSSLTEFLLWWEDRKLKEAIVIPEGTDAVQVMTIHKSKGLAFNVVMIPFNWEDRVRTNDIWVDTSNHFNKQLPAALIAGNKKLEYSYFSKEYQKEKEMSLLDSLNKLYVAMTRPKERLYIFSKFLPANLKDYEKKENLNSFLYKYDDNFPIKIGDSEMMHEQKQSDVATFSVTKRKKLDWREVISLKHTAEEIWDTETANKKRDWGKLLHLVLSEIHYLEQKDELIENTFKLGKCVKEDYEKLKTSIAKLLNHKEVKQYFTDDWDVKTEKEILMENGKTYIPDRLLFSKKSDEVIVIDYKTGSVKTEHEKQITEYADALRKMGKTKVKRVIIYISDSEIKVKNL